MQVHGSCHCGAIEFEAAVDPTRVTICHCTACQNLTGSAYRVTVALMSWILNPLLGAGARAMQP